LLVAVAVAAAALDLEFLPEMKLAAAVVVA
jgi:hypothetical protein